MTLRKRCAVDSDRQRTQLRRRPTQRARDIDRIAGLRAGAQQRTPALHRAHHHNVRCNSGTRTTRRLRQVAAGQRNLPSLRQQPAARR